MLARSLAWYNATQSPRIVAAREFIRRHPALRRTLQLPLIAILAPARFLRGRFKERRAVAPKVRRFINRETKRRARIVRSVPPTAAETSVQFRSRLLRGDPCRIVFLNDAGFQYGAGIAQRRQAASFLLRGWEVMAVASDHGAKSTLNGTSSIDRTLRRFTAVKADDAIDRVRALRPDVVVVGNIHGAAWPPDILLRLRAHASLVVAYMHDCYWVTGRCAYPGPCELYESGCNASCPTANEYPQLAPDKISAAWRQRAELFAGQNAIPLIANSFWTRDLARRRFGPSARVATVHLGLDHNLFAPMEKAKARHLLDLPQDKPIVLIGAIDVEEQRKGGPLFRQLHNALLSRTDVTTVIVGRASEQLLSARSFGLVKDERIMPLIVNAADVVISTAIEDAFGQMVLECAACGVPTVAFDVGGVSDIVVDDETGILVKQRSADALLQAADRLISEYALRHYMGRRGRVRVENRFTLAHQADAWIRYLGTT